MSIVFSDNFDSYSDGDLAGQGSWTASGTATAYDIQGSVVQAGAKAVSFPNNVNGTGNVYRDFTGISSGNPIVSFYGRNTVNSHQGVYFLVADSGGTGWYFIFENNRFIIYDAPGFASLVTAGGTYSANTWYHIEIEVDIANKQARGRVDGGAWGSWRANASFNGTLSRVGINQGTNFGGTSYVDTVSVDDANTTYNQSAAAVGAGAGTVLKVITSSAGVVHAIGAGAAAVTKSLTTSATTIHAVGVGVAQALKSMTMSITTVGAIGVASASVAASRAYLKTIAATAAGTATVATAMVWGKIAAAVGVGAATLNRTLSLARTFAATGVGVAGIIVTRGVLAAAVAQAVATVTHTLGKTLNAVATATARVQRDFWKDKYTAQGDDYDIKYPHGD